MSKRSNETEQLVKMDEDIRKNNAKSFYATFKQKLHKYEATNLCFKDANRKLAINNKDNCRILATYFENLLSSEEP